MKKCIAFLFLVILFGVKHTTVYGELLELKLHKTTYNLQSMGGVPISVTFADPLGSNGLAPSDDASPGQFQAFYSAGAVVAPTPAGSLRLNQSMPLADNVENLDLPRAEDGKYALIGGASGGAIMSAQASIMFGGIISVPESIYTNGVDVPVRNPDAHWSREPFKAMYKIVEVDSPILGIVNIKTDIATDFDKDDIVTMSGIRNSRYNGTYPLMSVSEDKKTFSYSLGMTDSEKFADQTLRASGTYNSSVPILGGELCQEKHSSDGYYYSPSAKAVFAVQAGPVSITWREAAGTTQQPDGALNVDWTFTNNKYYKLYNKRYLISSSSIKPAKKFYWNVLPNYNGPPMQLSSNVEDIKIVYNVNFPEKYFGDEYNRDVPAVEKHNTLFVQKSGSSKFLKSINATGRVFIELLGPMRDGVPKHLGFEIVDVYDASTPVDRVVYLGEKLLPFVDPNMDDPSLSIAFEGLQSSEHPKALRHAFEGRISNYAIKETFGDETVVAFWTQLGMAGLKWPVAHVSYKFKWPEDLDDYSHYVRPNLGKPDSISTAIQLPMENAPLLLYQDQDESKQERSLITKEDFKFYSWLGEDLGEDHQYKQVLTHRSLVRYTSTQSGVRFERIFSWLDEKIEVDNPINTTAVRHLDLWPKVTIRGNMDTQILIKNGNDYQGRIKSLRQQVFYGLGEQQGIDGLKSNPKFNYPRSPDLRSFVTSLETNVSDQDRDHAVALEGYFSPSKSGEYQFKINYDGSSELKLSTGDSPIAGFNKIASTGLGEIGENISVYIYLDSSQYYYLQGLTRFKTKGQTFAVSFKEKSDADYKAVGSENLITGLRVNPLEQNMFAGDTVYFDESMHFIFAENANKGATIVAGTLKGISSESELGIDALEGAAFREHLVESFNDRALLDAPRYLSLKAYVGQRLQVPSGEHGSGEGDYWAGYIDERSGDIWPYHAAAYINPLTDGFAAANAGSIIPVNAAPNNNTITVHWFRKTVLDSDPKAGFDPIYWPSVIVNYTIEYPSDSREIVLASNDGSGPLSSLEAKGSIYYQNNPLLIGYNPNEEHALMVGGQAYALRNDLNIYSAPNRHDGVIRSELVSGGDYSSDPFVLLEYKDSDGKYSISTFKVLAEKGQEGMVFDYLSEAGSVLQAPMPLPLLPKPKHSNGSLKNHEVAQPSPDEPQSWGIVKNLSYFNQTSTYENNSQGIAAADIPEKSVVPDNPTRHFNNDKHSYDKFTFQDRKSNTWVYRGMHDSLPDLVVGKYDNSTKNFSTPSPAEAVVGEEFEFVLHASRLEDELQLSPSDQTSFPNWLTIDGLKLYGSPGENDETAAATGKVDASDSAADTSLIILDNHNDKFAIGQSVVIPDETQTGYLISQIKSSFIDNDDNLHKIRISNKITSNATSVSIYEVISIPLTIVESRDNRNAAVTALIRVRDKDQGTDTAFVNQGAIRVGYVVGTDAKFPQGRPPYLAERPIGSNSLKMKFYYFSMEGFAFPGYPDNNNDGIPDVETTVDRVLPYLTDGSGSDVLTAEPLKVVYRPVWPKTTPTLNRGDTLTLPKYGLPAIRGQSSAEILYQQSIANAETDGSRYITVSSAERSVSLTVSNPDGDGYANGTYIYGDGSNFLPAENVKIEDVNGTGGGGFPPGEYRGDNGIPIEGNFARAHASNTRFHFNNGAVFVLDRAHTTSSDKMSGVLYGFRVSHHMKASTGGLRINGNVAGLTAGTVLHFSRGATFTISGRNGTADAAPEAGDLALSGTLSGSVVNGEATYQQKTITATSNGSFVAGDPFYFKNGVFILTSAVSATDTRLTGRIYGLIGGGAGTDADNSVGYNYPDLIKETESVKLIDPTREKSSNYVKIEGEVFPPSSVPNSYYQGKIYFPTLDPHLSKRFFFDPNRGKDGALVLAGKFMDELVGEKYLQLNVLSESDYNDLLNLCDSADPAFASWKSTIKGLKTEMEYFTEKLDTQNNPIKGIYNKDPNNSYVRNIGEVAEIYSSNVPVDSYALSAVGPGSGYVSILVGNGNEKVQPIGEPVTVHIIRVVDALHPGSLKVIQAENPLDERLTFQHSPDLAAKVDKYIYEWRKGYPVDGSNPPFDAQLNELDAQWLKVDPEADGAGKNMFTLGKKPGIDTLMDLYITMRYRSDETGSAWSEWTKPQLAEGWIKRVLAGINPFSQRAKDLFNNSANLDYSMLTQAGKRWEGDVALSLESINDFGLIEIYETVLNKGKNLSINAGINHNGANNALLLAAGYLNDLYMMVGNDAFADAYNPTIGMSTSDGGEYGDMSTALFAFKGQLATLLDEELALLRGRDDFMAPGVEANPVYNRLFWNYTRGIDSGEVIYALNYNIQERDGSDLDGNIDAADATAMYPQGHGDAFGHYMTALKGYYKLLADNDFTWVPQSESVLILGQEVAVDYMDERKFAAAAVAYARAGSQIVDLTWRKDYLPGTDNGWDHLGKQRENEKRYYRPVNIELDDGGQPIERKNTVRSWGVDHWASRVGQGTYVNWLAGNAMVPSVDDDPTHEGIQKVDRTTVLELYEIPQLAREIQTSLDNAAAGLNPLGLPENTVAFDIDPSFMEVGSGIQGETHFDQIYKRAVTALDNAVSAFDASKDITSLMRTEEDSASVLAVDVNSQELAYKHELIEIYGTPYPEDIGPGKLYTQGYDGPDLLNHMYIDYPSLPRSDAYHDQGPTGNNHRVFIHKLFDTNAANQELGDGIIGKEIAKITTTFENNYNYSFSLLAKEGATDWGGQNQTLIKGVHYIEYEIDQHGFFKKPASYIGKRKSPGALQSAAHEIAVETGNLENIIRQMKDQKRRFDLQVDLLRSVVDTKRIIEQKQDATDSATKVAADHTLAANTVEGIIDPFIEQIDRAMGMISEGTPDTAIFGFSNGGNFMAPIKTVLKIGPMVGIALAEIVKFGVRTAADAKDNIAVHTEINSSKAINRRNDSLEIQSALIDLEDGLTQMRVTIDDIDAQIAILDESQRNYRAILASGDRLQKEREIFRKRSAALVQGYRTRDAAFRIFRHEKLERYKSMLDLASRYTFLAAKAFDYETGLLDTSKGKRFISRIVASRALGVVDDGTPQFAGSNQGDPGLSSVLAEMSSDWEVLRGRLGFNNPDTYGTTLSLRTENYRLLPNAAGDIEWKQILETGVMDNLLLDVDAKNLCMQLDLGDGLPVPGILLNFRTTIQDGYNLFGKKLAAGDHAFSPSLFATKIMGVGVALEGYEGINYYDGDGNVVKPNPSINPNGLSANPYVYLIPVGVDVMRSPPLGDQSRIRTWNIEDATIPTPFNIGGSFYDSKRLFQTADSLTERMFNVRKHQAFRPVSDGSVFQEGPILPPSHHVNNRLVGRSVWNSSWKLIIPGKALLYDSKEGLDKFIRTVKDIKIHFETYSYSGN